MFKKNPTMVVIVLVLGAVLFFGIWNMVKNKKVVLANGTKGVMGDSTVNAPTTQEAVEVSFEAEGTATK